MSPAERQRIEDAAQADIDRRVARRREAERDLYAAVDRNMGLATTTDGPLDPLRHHAPCAMCGQRGPLIPIWMREKSNCPNASETFVCADGCEEASR